MTYISQCMCRHFRTGFQHIHFDQGPKQTNVIRNHEIISVSLLSCNFAESFTTKTNANICCKNQVAVQQSLL